MTQKPDKSYLANPLLKAAGVEIKFTQEQIKEYARCSQDPVYFAETYVHIVNVDRGKIKFPPYDYQKKMIRVMQRNRFVIAKLPRQVGKSTTVVAYILWYVLFQPDQNVAILANKLSTAKDMLGRLKMSYEMLPKWMQQGIVSWNKQSIELENGSKVISAATSSSAIRGGSFNMIFLDEFAHVPAHYAEEFFSSVYPVISSGKTTKVIIVSTPKGLNMYYKMWTDAVNKRNSYYPIEVHWSHVPGRDQKWKEEQIANTSVEMFEEEFECQFLGGTNTLISGKKLRTMPFDNPIWQNDDGLVVYKKPEKGRTYIMVADTSRGKGIDYHAFVVIDVTEMPYRLVARFRNDNMATLLYPSVIHKVAVDYNQAYVLIETNDVGKQVTDIMHQEIEYPNLLQCTFRGRKGQTCDGGFGGNATQVGVSTSVPVKRIGCSVLKSLIEEDKLIVTDYATIHEMSCFVSKKSSYEAEAGQHDDLVMCLVLFSWLSTQPYFREITDTDIRKKIYEDQMRKIDEDLTPIGVFDSHHHQDDSEMVPESSSGFIIHDFDDEDVWFSDEDPETRHFRGQL